MKPHGRNLKRRAPLRSSDCDTLGKRNLAEAGSACAAAGHPTTHSSPDITRGLLRRRVNYLSFGRRLFVLTFCLGCQLVVSQLQAFTFQTLPENLTGGEGFLLQLTGDSKSKYQILFERKKYKPFPVSEGVWEIFLPLGIKTTGERELIVEKTSPAGPAEKYSLLVSVTQKKIRTISPGKTSRKMRKTQPSISKQQKKVLAAINNREPQKYWDQPFSLPLQGEVGTEFGVKRNLGTYSSYHWGVDIDAPEGTPVQAANSGKIILSERGFNVYGNLLIVDHGQGVVSCYFHLSRIFKQAGDMVDQNEVIAEVGNTGWSTGPHLHFGIYLQGKPIDPLWMVSFTSELSSP